MSASSIVGILGATGPEGRGLATRLALRGVEVVMGSRVAARGEAAAEAVLQRLEGRSGIAPVTGATNLHCAQSAGVLFLAVPYAGQSPLLDSIAGELDQKIVASVVAPVQFEGGVAHAVPPESGSAAEEAAQQVPSARWVAGLHTLPASDLQNPARELESDALICGDDEDAKGQVMALVRLLDGLRPVDAGPLECARYLEGATALLININRRYRIHGSLRIMGL